MIPRTLTLHMDFHKNLPTPKVTSKDCYYANKLRTNLFGIYCGNQDVINCFMYDETIAGTGPNGVISLLDYLLVKVHQEQGKHQTLIVWVDNSPAQFKENYLFFYMDYLVKKGDFLRTDLKFLWEGHSYSYYDRRFGTNQKYLDNQETIEVPKDWATVLNKSHLLNIKVYWVSQEMIKDYKSFLKLQYVSRNEDLSQTKFEVKNLAWINFGIGEEVDDEGTLQLVHHPDSAFVRFSMDAKQPPLTVSYQKKKQETNLRPELLTILRQELRPVREDVKRFCLKLAQKYLNENAVKFYASLPCTEEDSDNED